MIYRNKNGRETLHFILHIQKIKETERKWRNKNRKRKEKQQRGCQHKKQIRKSLKSLSAFTLVKPGNKAQPWAKYTKLTPKPHHSVTFTTNKIVKKDQKEEKETKKKRQSVTFLIKTNLRGEETWKTEPQTSSRSWKLFLCKEQRRSGTLYIWLLPFFPVGYLQFGFSFPTMSCK